MSPPPADLAPLRAALTGYLGGRPAFRRFVREPLVGCAPADDPRWDDLRRLAHPGHLRPADLLPGARTVLAWFLPFQDWLVRENRGGSEPARSWAEAYVAVNELLGGLASWVCVRLEGQGYRAAADPPTHRFDRLALIAPWSHKSAAAICGLGAFGAHRMLITAQGAAGRCGSLVTDAVFACSAPVAGEFCTVRAGGRCAACAKACPVGALAGDAFDRQACWAVCRANAARFAELGKAEVCGKCAAACPAPGRSRV
jgi:epoxyqueuosine reductase